MILDISPSIRTPRLYVRPWHEGDLPSLHRIMSNQSVHTYTGDAPWTEEKARTELEWYQANKMGWKWKGGYFNCPLVLVDCDTLIGKVGLNPYDESEQVAQIEWTISEEHWHQGYATEIGRAILEYAFREGGFKRIVGFTTSRNMSARQVMKKIGMVHIGDQEHNNRKLCVFQIQRES
ncbi:GNAT family N-acetyltransferase [Photobacterium ganghwense]|uniref:GNAT family N-acetyltransferase n=2 Tax=Photobacterium TaxID=657 RepID=UPI000A0208FB|nr:GNAT family N-acetyltransferase [Photobacterium ganghwense]MBV1842356.1 GNAT family N-acetyltransferase [Photobacterium ganghwense]PSU09864.1 N-acetyltransferase [Photobacterium ganghwense]QSV17111.1 GNAT family N-acetyltransferase [Photobacterium ganghwense]